MKQCSLEWAEVEAVLRDLPGLNPAPLRPYLGAKGIHFFKMQYDAGDVIMPQGVFSDFAGVLMKGRVEVYRRKAPPSGGRSRMPTDRSGLERCWNRPGLLWHRLESWTLDHTDRLLGAEPVAPSWRARRARDIARALRGGFGRLEEWVRKRTEPPARTRWGRGGQAAIVWLAGWTQRRDRERKLADPRALTSDDTPGPGDRLADRGAIGPDGGTLPVLDRFLGVTSALWNLPRSVTLVAQPDRPGEPCELLLIKRTVLLLIQEQYEPFRRRATERFVAEDLPHVLAEDRLFRNTFYEEDVADWPGLLDLLRGRAAGPRPEASRRIRQLLDHELTDRLATVARDEPSPRDRYRVLGGLNALLKRRDLFDAAAWAGDLAAEAGELSRRLDERTENEVIRLNHLLVEAACGAVLRPAGPFRPLQARDFQAWLKTLGDSPLAKGLELRHYPPGAVVYREGEPSEALFLIVSGTVRITKRTPGGEILVNQLERDGYFGVSCIEEGASHSATVTTLTEVNAVVLGGEALRSLIATPAAGRKLRNERGRLRARDAQLAAVELLPPADPPEAVASKLLLATNLLRIDMDLCTRCDQCVRACAEAHDGVPRFQRPNPDLRFGRWEVAAACVHCSDAPCQSACPVGAITFLDDGAVQIHRHRCIGCYDCVMACPFDVIAMRPPPSPLDMPAQNTRQLVATKCDLCLTAHQDPPCVAACPYGAAERGAPRELFPQIKSWGEGLSPR